MTKVRKNPKFILRPDTGTLQLQYSFKGIWFRTNSHISVDRKIWDEGSQLIKDKGREEDNRVLQGMLRKIEAITSEYRIKHGAKPTAEYVRHEFERKKTPTDDILEVYDEFVVFKETKVKSLGVYNANKVKLEVFLSSKKYKILTEITTKFVDEYVNFLSRGGMQNSTCRKRVKIMKEFVTWCGERGGYKVNQNILWDVQLPTDDKEDSVESIFILTEAEFNTLMEKELPDRLDRVRDYYVLGSSTGLRYSDLVRLTKDHIKNNDIEIVTQKTSTFVRIPINETAGNILAKYNYALPSISDQKLNDYLYELFRDKMELLEKVYTIERRGKQKKEVQNDRCDMLSIHTSRNYFITHCIEKGIISTDIMAWTGQSSLKVFYDYVSKGRNSADRMKDIFILPKNVKRYI